MPKTTTLLVWVVVDEDGVYAVGRDQDEAAEAYRAIDGTHDESGLYGQRRVRVELTVPLPAPIVVTADVADDAAALVAAKVA